MCSASLLVYAALELDEEIKAKLWDLEIVSGLSNQMLDDTYESLGWSRFFMYENTN